MSFMRKVRIFIRGMRDGMDMTAMFGGGRDRIRRLARSGGSMADDWASVGRDLMGAIEKYERGQLAK